MLRLFSAMTIGAALLCAADAGWTDLTPAKGWTRVPIPKTATLDPGNQWRYDAKSKVLICAGDKGHEMLRSDREYKDYILHVEWRFKKLDGEPKYNSGVMVRTSADAEYMAQGQVGPGPAVWLFADYPVDGKKTRVNLRDKMKPHRVNPPGEWNTYEMTARGNEVSLNVNGADIGSIPVGLPQGYIGLEAEGFYIEFRNVRIKEIR